jgi:release factor glutamine methyltransferase
VKALGEVLRLSEGYLKERNIDAARRQAEEIIAHVIGSSRIELYMQFDRPLVESELEKIRQLIGRRAKGEPLAYLFGCIQFFNCLIEISPAVLIPRQETEILMHQVQKTLGKRELKGRVAWDVCTGSGYLGIALKKAFPTLQVAISDISPEALAVAKKNVHRNGVNVEVLQGDLLAPFEGKKTDIFLCNPPYISQAEYAALDPEVKNFEPHLALVGGKSGLEFYARLAAELPSFLNSGAAVFFEIGATQGEAVSSLFLAPCWKEKRVEKDFAGHDRFFSLEFE